MPKRNLDTIQKTSSRVIEGLERLSVPSVEQAVALVLESSHDPLGLTNIGLRRVYELS